MKNHLFFLLLSCCFLISNVNASSIALDESVDWVVYNCKTGEPIYSFSVPDKFINKDGSLVAPLEITLTQNGKSRAFSVQTKDLNIELPVGLSGPYKILIKVGSFSSTGKITI